MINFFNFQLLEIWIFFNVGINTAFVQTGSLIKKGNNSPHLTIAQYCMVVRHDAYKKIC